MHMYVCVFVCVCVRACVRACVRVCVRAYVHIFVFKPQYPLCNFSQTDTKVATFLSMLPSGDSSFLSRVYDKTEFHNTELGFIDRGSKWSGGSRELLVLKYYFPLQANLRFHFHFSLIIDCDSPSNPSHY